MPSFSLVRPRAGRADAGYNLFFYIYLSISYIFDDGGDGS